MQWNSWHWRQLQKTTQDPGSSQIEAMFRSVGQLWRKSHYFSSSRTTLAMQQPTLISFTQLSIIATNLLRQARQVSPAKRANFFFALLSCGISGAADLTVQMANGPSKMSDLDARRIMSMSMFGLCYTGFVQRLIYLRFDLWFGIGNSMKQSILKLCMDTFVHAPFIYIPTFYMTTGMLQGLGWSASSEKLLNKYNETLLSYMLIWPVPMFVCFRCIPETRRVVFIAAVAFVEKSIYSYLGNRPQPNSQAGLDSMEPDASITSKALAL